MNRGDIYLVTLDPTEGRERQGYRPVVVVSPEVFISPFKADIFARKIQDFFERDSKKSADTELQ